MVDFFGQFFGQGSKRSRAAPNNECVVFDLETTGLFPEKDHIIEIGAIHYTLGESNHRTFQAFIDPGVPIPKKITRITGITDDMVRGQDKPGRALREFRDFVGNNALVAYNADFDIGFLCYHGLRHGINFDCPVMDVLPIARRTWPGLRNYKLGTVAKHLRIEATPTLGHWTTA